jgi:FtsX-like permease family protein
VSGLFLAAWRLVLKRAASDGFIVGAAFVTVLLAASLLAAGPIYSDAVALSGLERTLAEAPARESGVQVSGRIPLADADKTANRVERGIRDVFDTEGVAVHESGMSDSYSLPAGRGLPKDGLAVFGFYEGLEQNATLVSGVWPPSARGGAVEAALPVPAAEALGLAPGDELTLAAIGDSARRVDVRISGTYRPDDPHSVFWWGNGLETEGSRTIDFTTYGPFVVPEAVFRTVVGDEADLAWRAASSPGRYTVGSLRSLRESLAGLEQRLNAGSEREVSVDTGLVEVLDRTEHLLTVTRSGVLIPSVQLAILAGAALLFLAGLLSERRGLESAILRSRGAGGEGVATLAVMEGALLAVPAALLAPWVASVGLRSLNHVGPLAQIGLRLDPRVTPLSYALAALAALLCVGALALPALRSGAVTAAVAGRGRPRPQSLFQRAWLDVALVLAALLAYWQLRRYGGPVVESVEGRLGIDPLLIAAPALGLLAGAVLALRVVPAAASLVEKIAASARGMVAALGTRELARRPHRYARSALLLTLALAIGLFASAYSRTWLASQRDQADYAAAADLRVEPSRRSGAIPSMRLAGAYSSLAGVRSALPVYRETLDLTSSGTSNLLGVDAARAPGAVRFRSDLAGEPLGAMLAPLARARPKLASVALPGRPSRLALDVTVDVARRARDQSFFFVGGAPRPSIALVIQDGDGLLYRLPTSGFGIFGAHRRVVFDLLGAASDGAARPSYPLDLVAVETLISPSFRVDRPASIDVHSLEVSDSATAPFHDVSPPGPVWRVDASQIEDADRPARITGIRDSGFLAFDVTLGSISTFAARGGITFTAVPGRNHVVRAIPAIATDRFLADTGSAAGARIPLGPDGPNLVLTGSAKGFPTLPDTAGGVVVDLPTYAAATWMADGTLLEPSEWWLDVDGPAAPLASRLAAPPFSSVSVVDRVARARQLSTDPVALGISGALYIGFAAAAIFAVIGFAVSSAISAAERTTEFAVLRSVGLSRRQLSGALALEGALTACLALAAGTALGVLLAWFVLPYVSLSGEGGRPFPGVLVHFPWETAALLEGSLLLALAVVTAVEIRVLGRVRLAPALRAGEDR